jgi:hypothetical protein
MKEEKGTIMKPTAIDLCYAAVHNLLDPARYASFHQTQGSSSANLITPMK